MCVLNIQSAQNKVCNLNDIMVERNLDFMVLSEFWLKPTNADYHVHKGNIDSDKYRLVNYPRKDRKRGGGIAIIHNNKNNVKPLVVDFKPRSFEFAVIYVLSLFTILAIYRPPNLGNRQEFINELDQLVSILSLDYNRLLLCGDVNLHIKSSSDLFAKQFLQHLSDFDFFYHVAGQTTHQHGGS